MHVRNTGNQPLVQHVHLSVQSIQSVCVSVRPICRLSVRPLRFILKEITVLSHGLLNSVGTFDRKEMIATNSRWLQPTSMKR